MMNRNGFGRDMRGIPAMLLAASVGAIALSNGGCSAADTAAQAASGCDEFKGGSASVAALSIDGKSKAFVLAAADFVGIVDDMETKLYAACKAIDMDLGVPDTWSAMSGIDAQVTESCNQAQLKIKAILAGGDAGVVASCVLSVDPGQCEVKADVEASCEASCSGMASCTPPDVRTVCDPGSLSVVCDGSCMASAYCEGTVTAEAVCQGSCSANCTGECDVSATAPTVHCEGTCAGKCTGQCDGSTASGTTCAGKCVGRCDANCTYTGGVKAHCDGSCKGTCSGDCKIDANANVMCGGSVRCRGGCTTMGTLPKCETEVKPAMCTNDVNCQGACQAHAEASASCTPPSAALDCGIAATGDLQKLVATLQTNLPAILDVVQTRGPLAAKAGIHVADTGSAFVGAIGATSGKALVCATTAVGAAATASISINVTVMASASVSTSCGGPGA
jgi:hypothetical protein